MATDEVLSSPAIGTGLDSLGSPCGDSLRPADPPAPEVGPRLGLTFSGGGFRATLAALGVVRALADAGVLGQVRYVSSVSGGSVANGILAIAWPKLRAAGFTPAAVDREVIEPIVDRVSTSSLKGRLIRNIWRLPGRTDRTGLLADAFDSWWFDGIELEQLDPQVRWIVNAANVTTGVRFAFERDVVGDYVVGLTPTAGTGIRLATAASASAAVPGAFAKVQLPERVSFPCESSRGRPLLLDGGVYDNTGLEALDGDRYRDVFTVSLNAGGVLQMASGRSLPIVGDLLRSNSLLYRQSSALRTRWMVDRFLRYDAAVRRGEDPPADARRGVLVALATTFPEGGGAEFDAFRAAHPEHRTWEGRDLAFVPTVFDRLDRRLCAALVYRGWWLTMAALVRYHHATLPIPPIAEPPSLG